MVRPSVAILDDYDRLTERSPAIEGLQQFADVRFFHEHIAPADLPLALQGCSALPACS